MVSCHLPSLKGGASRKPLKNLVPLPKRPLDVDHADLDFSDVFGPLPTQAPDANKSSEDPDLISNPREKLEKLSLQSTGLLDKASSEDVAIGLRDFQVLKLVGKGGGYGKVYQVRNVVSLSSDIFAMKVIRKAKTVDGDLADCVQSERENLRKVDHPFIVHLRNSFQTKHRLYLVLDFVNGGNLFFQLKRQGLLSEDIARIYAGEIVSAVSHLHANGILHRDLKPENVLLDAEGHALLTDFGFAKQFNDPKNTRSDSIRGTMEYMAPEVVLGRYHDTDFSGRFSRTPFKCKKKNKK
ncbi:serine/threonine-protein kinase AtPK2/AtPK19-like [Coffea eugenioides]|uniref:serine/threonine-protein kinase AtPK2/AtPK19-like n=1 Tax=Coffea eugenioides TaxID=49369 RepID=UPI000F6094F3|nr:serine/threonine-protein kinase AtPK2/AtPK19-like [Coffea eugenioides]